MNLSDFWLYDENNEKENGIYWKFVNASDEEIEKSEIYLPDVSKITKDIKNIELKEKMKSKILYLLKKNGINYKDGEACIDKEIFPVDELKDILKNDIFYNNLLNKVKENYFFGDTIQFIYKILKIEDDEFSFENIKKIIEIIKNSNESEEYITKIIDKIKQNKILFNRLIDCYWDILPKTYKNYIKIKNNKNYIYDKIQKYKTKKEKIGIDPDIKIGPEIETNHPYELYFELYDQQESEKIGKVHPDATVPDGIEISCEPFSDTPNDIAKFHALCDTLTEMGYYYDEKAYNASGQINLGLDYLDTKQAIINFYEIYGNCEELLFYISNEKGQLFRQDVYINSRIKPLSEIIGTRIIDEDITREELIKILKVERRNEEDTIKGLKYKKNTVCIRGKGEYQRLEFRIPNGGNNFKTWIDNIRLYGKIIEISKKLADILKKEYLTEEEQRLLRLKYDLQDKNLTLEEKLYILMDLLEFDENIKQIYLDRYYTTIEKIKETGTQKYNNPNRTDEPAFDEVNFLEKYDSALDGEATVSYDPFTGKYQEKNRKQSRKM